MTEKGKFYKVISNLYYVKLPDPQEHGYEYESDFRTALNKLVKYWHGRTGECINERHGFLQLRFHDTPGGKPDEAWLPPCLLESVPKPAYLCEDSDEPDEITKELDEIHGFD